MANRGNFVDAQSLIDDLNKAFIKHKAVIEESANALIKLEGAYGNLPSDYIRAQKEILDLQNKQIRNESQLETLQKKKIATQEAIARQQNRITKEQERYVQQLEKEKQKLEASQSIYNKVQQRLNALQKEYRDLAVSKELGAKLTFDEIKRYNDLEAKIKKYDTTLKAVDASMGKYQRNVGNYASGFNPLSNSINQLTREMPAFANSVQTGFMAISNNLPIFFDAIEQANAEIKQMRANGEQVPSLFSRLTSSILSWGTALSIGVTLLTVLGPKIWDSVMGTKAKKEALDKEKEALEEKARAEKQAYEQQVKYASDEQSRSKLLLETAKNVKLSMDERVKAVKELQQRYPDYLGKLSQEKILAGETAEMEYKLNDALMKRALFLATQDKIIEKTKELVDAQMQYAKTNQAVNGSEDLYNINANKTINTKQKLRLATESDLQSTKALEQAVKNSNKTLITSTSVYQEKELAIRKQLDVLYAMLNANSSFVDVVNEDTKATKKNTEAKEENIKIFTEDWFQKQISELEKLRGKVADTTAEYASYTNQINVLKMLLDQLQGKEIEMPSLQTEQLKALDEGLKNMTSFEEVTTDVKKLDESLKQLFQTTANGALSSFGLDSLIPMFDGTFNKMWETANTFNEKFAVGMKYIGDIAKQTFEFINMQQQAQFDAQFQRLEQERDVALLFAGESATAREEIERQYDERRKAIQRRQAEAQKKVAIFNSIVNTAQGVTSALATANIPLAILIGILGAVQTTMIASQQIPQFYKGTDNAPEGWAYTQEKGAEIITDKSGKIKSFGSDKGAQLTYLNKGDKVYTAEQSSLMFDYGLNSLLSANGISMPKVDVNIDNSLTNAKLDEIAKAIKEKDSILVSRDRRGEELYKINNGNRQKLVNTRLKIGKFDV